MLLIFKKSIFHRNASSFWMNNCHSPTLSGLRFRRPFVFFSRHMEMQLARVVGGRAVSWLRPRVRQVAHRSATFHGPPTRHNRRENERGVLASSLDARQGPSHGSAGAEMTHSKKCSPPTPAHSGAAEILRTCRQLLDPQCGGSLRPYTSVQFFVAL